MESTNGDESVWRSLSASASSILAPQITHRGTHGYEALERRVMELEREAEAREMLHEMRYGQWRKRIQDLEEQLQYLQTENRRLHEENTRIGPKLMENVEDEEENLASEEDRPPTVKLLKKDHVRRYSRQLLLKDGFGVEGQCKLLSSSVLVIGAGGIGSTALLYLAATGIGRITIVDCDEVEVSNLHRQIIHREASFRMNKAESASLALKALNSSTQYVAVKEAFSHENALDLVSRHDCIVDATDNQRTRYLINDACVLADKPLVSGSAIGTEGQLSVYSHGGGSCYRCLYPNLNPTEGCKSCSDTGVLGTVPGVIGVLQAVETVKILTGIGDPMNDRLLMYDSLQCSFLAVKRPPKQQKCLVCGPERTIETIEQSQASMQEAPGPSTPADDISNNSGMELPRDMEISCTEYNYIRRMGDPHILLDVRSKRQFEMVSLDGATVMNIPLSQLRGEIGRISLRQIAEESDGERPIYCICRRGIFSTEATLLLAEAAKTNPFIHSVFNIRGGLEAWSDEVDPSFPKY